MVKKLKEVYKCEVCGNLVNATYVGGGTLNCCGKEMKLLNENTVDASKEKHIPIAEKIGTTIKVKVGSVAHPMEDKHYIAWIELVTEQGTQIKFLKPGEKPEAQFNSTGNEKFTVREYCNLHGLWKGE